MKKVFLVATLVVVGFLTANAQNTGFRFGAGLHLGLPIGDWADYWSVGIGVEAQGEYMFSEKVSGVLNSGYTSFAGKKIDVGLGEQQKVDPVGLIPIMAGVRVYPAPQFFIGARAGLGILTGNGESTSAFQYRPEIGYNGGPIQIALGFNGLSKDGESNSFIGLTAIYVFGGKKQ